MGSKRRDRYIKWRGGIAYYYRRTPSDILSVDPRRFVEHSLKTSDRSVAEARRDAADAATEELWQHYRTIGKSASDLKRYQAAVLVAQQLGFPYRPTDELLKASDRGLLQRLDAINSAPAKEPVAEALLGTVEKPELTLSEALEVFWELAADRIVGKSDEQIRIWHNPRKRAVKNFITVVEDKALGELTRSDVLVFRSWWLERIQAGSACAGTANKDFTHLSDIFQTVVDAHQLDLTNPFRGLRLKNNIQSKRTSLTGEEVVEHLLGKGCLDGLNDQARAIVQICAETGARPIEVINRTQEDIVLDEGIPHMKIRPNVYGALKTPTSERDIPLLGVALDAFKQHPSGFPRYAGKASNAVNAINKYFRENGTLPRGASLYSLRHGFQDRLIAVRVPERVQADLMGHALSRPRYGAGPDLTEKQHWLQKTALLTS